MCCCFLLPLTPAGEFPSLPHASIVCAVSVILAIDCRVFSPHYWECMEHNSQWVLHPHIFQRHCDKVMCCCFLLPPTSVGESPPLYLIPQWCVWCQWSLLLTAMFCLLTTGNAWNITGCEYCIPNLPVTLWQSCYVLLFSPSSHLSRWVSLFTSCLHGVCNVKDPCYLLPCFVSSLLGMNGT